MIGTDIEVACPCGGRISVGFQRLGERVACERCGALTMATLRLDDLVAPTPPPLPVGPALVPAPALARVTSSRRGRCRSGARAHARAARRLGDTLTTLLWIAGALLAVVVFLAR